MIRNTFVPRVVVVVIHMKHAREARYQVEGDQILITPPRAHANTHNHMMTREARYQVEEDQILITPPRAAHTQTHNHNHVSESATDAC